MNEYTPVEILRLQTATQLTVAFINKSRALTQEVMEEIIDDAYIATEYLLKKCETPPDNRLNQENVQVRKKLGE